MLDWRELVYEGVVEDITEEVTEKVTEEVTEKVTEKVTEEVTEKVTEEVTEKVREEGIQIFILDNLEERIPKERIITKLQKRFKLTEEKSEQYYKKFAAGV